MEAAVLNSGSEKSFLRPVTKLVNGFWNLLISMAENNSRMRKLEQLTAMTDAELAKKGLKRDEIVRHVFADYMGV